MAAADNLPEAGSHGRVLYAAEVEAATFPAPGFFAETCGRLGA